VSVHALVSFLPFAGVIAAAILGPRRVGRLVRSLTALVRRVERLRPEPPRPVGRPIEQIACDVRRLSNSFRRVPDDASFVRFEGCCRAYDDVLVEACRAVEVEHLLRVLPPGPDLDRERRRVELVLWRVGLLLLDDVA
jgi:hypothetical protein